MLEQLANALERNPNATNEQLAQELKASVKDIEFHKEHAAKLVRTRQGLSGTADSTSSGTGSSTAPGAELVERVQQEQRDKFVDSRGRTRTPDSRGGTVQTSTDKGVEGPGTSTPSTGQ